MTARQHPPRAAAATPSGAPQRRDLRLLIPALAAWAGAALGAARPGRGLAALVAIVALLATAYVLLVRRGGRRSGGGVARRRARGAVSLACATLACALAGVVAASARTAARDGPLADLARDRAVVTVDLAVTDDPQPITGRVVGAQRIADTLLVEARAERLTRGTTTIRLRGPITVFARGPGWADRLPGERLRVRGRLRAPLRAGSPPSLEPYDAPVRLRAAPLPGRVAGRLRAGLREAAGVLPPDARGLLPGLVVGDTSGLDPAVREDFRRTGLTHLVAVSGQNVAVLLAALLLVARRCGLGPRAAAALGGAGLAFFVVLARPSPSVLRAATMGAFGLVGTVTGRERAALRLLAGAALVLVLLDPALARSLGFALSTAATAGLLVLGPPWRARLARRLPGWVADAVATPLAAQAACAPLLAATFGRVSIVAVPANVLVAPAVPAATIAGFVAAATAPLSLPLARVAARIAGLPVGWLVAVARRGAGAPAGQVTVPTGAAGAVIAVALVAAAVLLLARRAGRIAAVVATTAAVTATAVVTYVAPAWPPPGWRLVVCDVGQGDALVVRTSAGHVLVDAGPDPVAADRCLRDLRVRRLAAVVLTHFHADHVEGLPGVLRGRTAAQLVVSPLAEPAEEHDRVARWAAERRIPTRVPAFGERWTVGDTAFDVLGPATAFRGTESDPNNSSLVLRVGAPGLTLLLTGDVEEPAQLALVARGVVGRADVLKVPHHGSARQTAEFLDATGAAAAIVSAGRTNPYGHPAPGTLGALGDRGMRTFRTDRDGHIAVSTRPDGVRVTGRQGTGTPPRAPTPAERALAFRRAAAPALWCPVTPRPRTDRPVRPAAAAGERTVIAAPPGARRTSATRAARHDAARHDAARYRRAARAPPRQPGNTDTGRRRPPGPGRRGRAAPPGGAATRRRRARPDARRPWAAAPRRSRYAGGAAANSPASEPSASRLVPLSVNAGSPSSGRGPSGSLIQRVRTAW